MLGVPCAVHCNVCVTLKELPVCCLRNKNACPLCLFFSSQRDDEDGDDMDSYQVSLLLSFCGMGHGCC